MDVAKIIESLLNEVQQISRADTVVGDPIEVGASKLIPISKLSLGFGVGAGNGEGEGQAGTSAGMGASAGGAGGGVKIQPMAFIAVAPDGSAQLLSLDEPESNLIEKLLQVVPEIVEKYALSAKSKKDSDDED